MVGYQISYTRFTWQNYLYHWYYDYHVRITFSLPGVSGFWGASSTAWSKHQLRRGTRTHVDVASTGVRPVKINHVHGVHRKGSKWWQSLFQKKTLLWSGSPTQHPPTLCGKAWDETFNKVRRKNPKLQANCEPQKCDLWPPQKNDLGNGNSELGRLMSYFWCWTTETVNLTKFYHRMFTAECSFIIQIWNLNKFFLIKCFTAERSSMTWVETRVFRTAAGRAVFIWFARLTTAWLMLIVCYHNHTQNQYNFFSFL